jgi:hypothetical protein
MIKKRLKILIFIIILKKKNNNHLVKQTQFLIKFIIIKNIDFYLNK